MSDQTQTPEPLIYSGGAARSGRLPQMRLIPRSFLWHTAEAFSEGNEKYEKIQEIGRPTPLTSNWRKGDLTFFLDAYNHLLNHAADASTRTLELGLTLQGPEPQEGFVYNEVRKTLEDLGHAAANIAFLIEWLDSGAAVEMMAREVLQVREIHRSLAERRKLEDEEKVARLREAFAQELAKIDPPVPALSPSQETEETAAEEEALDLPPAEAPADPPAVRSWLKAKTAELTAKVKGN
jgi:hypothetical protein